MHFSTLITTLAYFAATGLAGYVLEDDYIEQGFFNQFSFFQGQDPTDGFVVYQSQDAATSAGLVSESSAGAYLGVDHENNTPAGRPSVRVTSNKSYQFGLVVANITHMPGGICGTWPAFWTVGPNWPIGGEIDIVEGVNNQDSNDMTLHTSAGVTLNNAGDFSGSMSSSYCGPTSGNTGCQIGANNVQSYGAGFNSAGGGIYAMEWTSTAINVFFFSNSATVPSDILGSSPDPTTWGTPVASFAGAFDLATTFVNQQIIINTDFCGDWAGNAWASSSCYSSQWPTCDSYVAANPAAFVDAYWQFADLKVYQPGSSAASSAAASSAAASSAAAPSTYIPTSTSTSYSSTYVATSTSMLYVTVPAATTSQAAASSAYVPWIGGDGSVDDAEPSTPTPAPTPTGEGWFSTSTDGEVIYEREEEVVRGRYARHLRAHKRRGARV